MRVSDETPIQSAVVAWAGARNAYHRTEGDVRAAEHLDRAEDRIRDLDQTFADLLGCCKRALTESARVHPDFLEQLNAAIAKAEGRAS